LSKNKNLACNLIHTFWNSKEWGNHFDEHLSSHLIHELIVGKRLGRETLKMMSRDWCHSFPDLHVEITEVEEIGGNVIINMEVSGTYEKPLVYSHNKPDEIITETTLYKQIAATPPTGKKIFYTIEDIYFFHGNQLVRYLSRTDPQHLFNQLNLYFHEEEYQGQKLLSKNRILLLNHLNQLYQSRLSKREIECLSLSLLGFSAKQIGDFFGLSSRTIESHLHHALHEIGVFSRLDCIEKFIHNQTLLIWHDLGKILLRDVPSKHLQHEVHLQ